MRASQRLVRAIVFHLGAGLGCLGPVLELLWRLAQAWPGRVLHVPGLLLTVGVLEVYRPLLVVFPQKLWFSLRKLKLRSALGETLEQPVVVSARSFQHELQQLRQRAPQKEAPLPVAHPESVLCWFYTVALLNVCQPGPIFQQLHSTLT